MRAAPWGFCREPTLHFPHQSVSRVLNAARWTDHEAAARRFCSPFSILTATVTASLGLSLSMPRASAITTWPKQPSPRGLPRVNLWRLERRERGEGVQGSVIKQTNRRLHNSRNTNVKPTDLGMYRFMEGATKGGAHGSETRNEVGHAARFHKGSFFFFPSLCFIR